METATSHFVGSKPLPGAMQELLINLLCFDERGGDVRSRIPARLFEGYYKQIAESATEYWAKYGKAPASILTT